MNGYIAFYKGQKLEVWAATAHQAQLIAAAMFRERGRSKSLKPYQVTVVLSEKDGQQVTHTPDF